MRGAGTPNGLEMSRPASSSIVSQIRFAAAGRVGSIELLGAQLGCPRILEYRRVRENADELVCRFTKSSSDAYVKGLGLPYVDDHVVGQRAFVGFH